MILSLGRVDIIDTVTGSYSISNYSNYRVYKLKIAISAYPPAFDASVKGCFRPIIAVPFGLEKLEWLGYPTVK